MTYLKKIWIEIFEQISQNNNAVFKYNKDNAVLSEYEFLTCSVHIKYFDDEIIMLQNGISGNCEVRLSYLIFEYRLNEKFTLSINKRDYFDIFYKNKGIITGNNKFDKYFKIQSSNKPIALKIFTDETNQNIFLNNPLLVFNIREEKKGSLIKFKNMQEKQYNIAELQIYLNIFKHIIDKILN